MLAQWQFSDRQLLFLPFSLCGNTVSPLDQFFIRRLTEQVRPLALTLHSLIPLWSSTPPSLLPRPQTHTNRRPVDLTQTSKPAKKVNLSAAAETDKTQAQNRKTNLKKEGKTV